MTNSSGGWVSIHRKLWDNKLFKNEPFSDREAWIWLIAHANYKDTTVQMGSELIPIKRGELIRSISGLASVFHWDIRRCRRYLKRLINGYNISVLLRPNRWYKITICNYGDYQERGTTDGTTNGTTDGTRIISKQDNKKKDKKDKSVETSSPPTELKHIKIDSTFHELLKDEYPKLDIDKEIKKADFWLVANPKKMKKDFKRFLRNWMETSTERQGIKSNTSDSLKGLRDMADNAGGK